MNEEVKAFIQTAMHTKDHPAIIQMVQEADDPARFAWEVVEMAIEAKDEVLVDVMMPHLDKVSHAYPLIRAVHRNAISILKKLIPLTEPHQDRSSALIQAAGLGRTAMVKILLPHSDAMANESEALLQAAKNGHLATVRALIPHSEPKEHDSQALQAASSKAYVKVVRALLPFSSAIQCSLSAFPSASAQGHLDVIELLIKAKLPDPLETYCAGLDSAVRGGHLVVVQRLLEVIVPLGRPRRFGQIALFQAAGSGRLDIVEALLAVTDQSAGPEHALANALKYGHEDVVEALMGPVAVEDARRVIHRPELLAKFEALVARQAAAAQRTELHEVTKPVGAMAPLTTHDSKAGRLRL